MAAQVAIVYLSLCLHLFALGWQGRPIGGLLIRMELALQGFQHCRRHCDVEDHEEGTCVPEVRGPK